MSKFTPGPWRAFRYGGSPTDNWFIVAANHDRVCGGGSNQIIADDARLIAAAPELYEALAEFAREYDGFQKGDGDPCPTLTKARAALAKATGDPQ